MNLRKLFYALSDLLTAPIAENRNRKKVSAIFVRE